MNAVAMQTVATQSTAVAGKALRSAARAAVPRVSRCVVRASAEAESRRAVLTGLLAGVIAISAPQAQAFAPEIRDDRTAIDRGFELIYEARDTDLPQSQRDGLDQARGDVEATKKRVSESEKRLDDKVGGFIEKQYWTLAREELRLQVGTLRFDINTLSNKLDKSAAKKAQAAKKTFNKKVEDLDFALRKKDPSKAAPALAAASKALDDVIAIVV